MLFDVPILGLDTRTDPKLLPPGVCSDIQNLIPEPGKWRKRFGYTALTKARYDGGNLSDGRKLAAYGDQLVLYDRNNLYSYSSSTTRWAAAKNINQGVQTYYGWNTEVNRLFEGDANLGTPVIQGDSAQLSNVLVVAWVQFNGGNHEAFYAAYDATTGTTLIGPKSFGSSGSRQVLVRAVGTQIHIYRVNTNTISVKILDPASLAISDTNSPINLKTDAAGLADVPEGNTFDVVTRRDNTAALLVYYRRSGGTDRISACWVLPSGTLGNGANGFAASTDLAAGLALTTKPFAIACHTATDDSDVAVVYDSTGFNFIQCTAAFGGIVTGTAAIGGANKPMVTLWCSSTDASFTALAQNTDFVQSVTVNGAGVAGATATVLRHSGLASHLFLDNSALFFHAVFLPEAAVNGSPQTCYVLANLSGVTGVGKIPLAARPIYYSSVTGTHFSLPRVQSLGNNQLQWVCRTRASVAQESTPTYNIGEGVALSRVLYDQEGNHARSIAEFNGVLYTSGPQVLEYDGVRLREQGFVVYPEGVSTSQGGGGSLTALGTYTYHIYYEKINARGQRTQSTTAEVTSITLTGANNRVTLTIPTLPYIYWDNGGLHSYRAVGYRSEANGSIRYRCFDVALTTSTDTVTVVDDMADTTLNVRELDYQNTPEVDNAGVPPLRALHAGPDRLWGVDCTNRRRVYFSKLIDNDLSVEFTDAFFLEFPDEIVAVATLTNQLVAFGSRGIYAVAGEGPGNTGVGEFSAPVRIPGNIGIADPRTLVETPKGWVFISARGFYLLDFGMDLAYIGSPVHAYNDQTFVAATLLADVNQVRFLTDDGRTLVWNHEYNLWTTFTNVEGVSACVSRGIYYYAQSTGQVLGESTAWSDNGTAIEFVIETGWLRPVSVHGWPESGTGWFRLHRAYLVGEAKTDTHMFEAEHAINYEDFDDPVSILFEELPVIRWGLERQKCMAARFRLTESISAGVGEGCEFSSINLELSPMQGGAKIADAA